MSTDRIPYRHYCIILLLILSSNSLLGQFTVGGSASNSGGGCFQLTSATISQAGYVYQNTPLNLNDTFDYKFQVYLGTNNGGADGIMFVLRGSLSTPYIGSNGGAIGYDGSGFTTNSLGIEVDTWNNGTNGDLVADHIGIFKNGSNSHTAATSLAGPIQASATSVNVEDGNYHTMNVRWDPATQELEVYLDCDYRLQYVGDLINTVFNGDSLVHWGFLGTTGGASNVQGFCFTEPIDSLMNDMLDETICLGSSVQLNAGTSALSYSWTPSTGLSSTSTFNPTASPTSTTTYVVEATYQCDTAFDTVNVTVIQANFTASGIVTDALCNGSCDGEIDLSISNAAGSYGYLWSTGDTTQDVTSLCQGTYTVTIQDIDTASSSYLCTLESTFTVNEPAPLLSDIINASKTSCPNSLTCDASADADASGGTSPYYYLWSSGEITTSASQLCSDTNWLTVTDANGCESTAFKIIQIPDEIVTDAFADTMICISKTAALIAASSGGTPPFSYVWRSLNLNGPIVSSSQTLSISPDVNTQYFVASTDSKGCIGDTAEVVVKVRPELGIEIPDVDTICPYDTISIEVVGIGGDSNYTFSWSAGAFGSNILVSPDEPIWYRVTVSDFCGTPSYVDSVFVQVGGYSPIDAKIRLDDDSLCIDDQTFMIASGRGGFHGSTEYQYRWSSNSEKSNILFVRPQQTRTYSVTISDLCLSQPGVASATIYIGNPVAPMFEVLPDEVCAASEILIKITNYNESYTYRLAFGDGDTLFDFHLDSTYYSYSKPGCYDVNIAAVTDFGCFAQRTQSCAVRILDQPVASFISLPNDPSNLNPILDFRDNSVGANRIVWYVEDDTLKNVTRFQREFFEANQPFEIKLVATSAEGCVDSITKSLNYVYETVLYFPQAFSPNEDGLNDEFLIVGEGITDEGFELVIFDRWGHEVFTSRSVSLGWNGFLRDGSRAPQGTYPFKLTYYNSNGELRRVRDQVIISSAGKKRELR